MKCLNCGRRFRAFSDVCVCGEVYWESKKAGAAINPRFPESSHHRNKQVTHPEGYINEPIQNQEVIHAETSAAQ